MLEAGSQITVGRRAPSEGCAGASVPCLSPSSWGWRALFGTPWLVDTSSQSVSAFLFISLSPCVLLVFQFPLFIKTRHTGVEPTLMTHLNSLRLWTPVFKPGHLLRCWGLEFQCMNLGRILQPVSVCTWCCDQYHSKPSLQYLKTVREDKASRY